MSHVAPLRADPEARWKPLDPGFAERVRTSFARQGAMRLIGAVLADVRPGYCAIALVPRPEISQQHGYVHAGIVSAIVDSAGGYAGFTLFPANASVLTVEFKLNLLAPAAGERLVAEGFAGPHTRDYPWRGPCGARGEAHAGRVDAADADGDARQGRRVSGRAEQTLNHEGHEEKAKNPKRTRQARAGKEPRFLGLGLHAPAMPTDLPLFFVGFVSFVV